MSERESDKSRGAGGTLRQGRQRKQAENRQKFHGNGAGPKTAARRHRFPALFQSVGQAINEAPKVSRAALTPLPEVMLGDMANARIAAAYQEELDKWDALIEAAARNFGLSREQRAVAIASLRRQQKNAAQAVQKRVMDEENQTLNAYRRFLKQQQAKPTPASLTPAA